MTRTALLVRCYAGEADRIRVEAQRESRTISDYVLNIAVKAAAADDYLFSKRNHDSMNEFRSRRLPGAPGQRTAILVRCASTEAERIREAARRREMRINSFILQALKNAWSHQVPVHRSPVEAVPAAD